MKKHFLFCLPALLFFLVPLLEGQAPGSRKKPAPPRNRYQEWLSRDVAYIITPEEKQVFTQLKTDDEREQFVDQFWLKRDPDPMTFANEYKEEHYRRLAYVNTYYGSGIPGWKTDRGRIYILYGPPAQIEANASGSSYERPRSEGGGRTATFPFEVWRYRHIDGIGDDVTIEFVDKSMTGQYTLSTDPSEKDALLRVPGLGKTLLEEAGVASKTDRVLGVNQQETVLQMGRSWKDQSFERIIQSANLNRPPEIRFRELQQSVQARVLYRDIPVRIRWEHIWVDDQRVLVPLTMVVPSSALAFRMEGDGITRSSSVQYYGRVISVTGRITREFEQELSFHPSRSAGGFVILRQVLLPPGRYRLELVLKDLVSNKYGFAETGISVVNDRPAQAKMSSLILAHRIEVLTQAPDALDAAVIGDLRIHPVTEPVFSGKSNLGVYFQCTAPESSLSSSLPIEVQYRVSRGDQVVEEVIDREGITVHRRDPGRMIAFAFLSLGKMAPGNYTLSVTLKIPENEPLTAGRPFSIRTEGGP